MLSGHQKRLNCAWKDEPTWLFFSKQQKIVILEERKKSDKKLFSYADQQQRGNMDMRELPRQPQLRITVQVRGFFISKKFEKNILKILDDFFNM